METSDRVWTRPFTVYWLAVVQSTFGSSLTAVVNALLVFQITGKASAMGVTLALALLPSLLSPFAGVIVDRVAVRTLLATGNFIRAALIASILFSILHGEISILHINVVAFLGGMVGAFTQPASGALLPQIVKPENLARASGLLGMGTQSAQLVGLLAGAALVTWVGTATSLAIDALTFVIMGFALFLIKMPSRVAIPAKKGFWQEFGEGVRAITTNPEFAIIPLLALVINVAFAPVQMLLPEYTAEIGLGSGGYGIAMAFILGGMLIGSISVAKMGKRFKPVIALPAGLICAGVSLFLMGNSVVPVQFLASALVLGSGVSLTNTAIAYLGQTVIAQEFRGRVFGLINAIAQAGMPITLLLVGPLADSLGGRVILSSASIVVIATTGFWMLLRLRDNKVRAAKV